MPLHLEGVETIWLSRKAQQQSAIVKARADCRVEEVEGAIDVVFRPKLADQLILKQKRRGLRVLEKDFKRRGFAHERAHLAVRLSSCRVAIANEPLANIFSLTGIDHAAVGILEKIDRRLFRERLQKVDSKFSVESFHVGAASSSQIHAAVDAQRATEMLGNLPIGRSVSGE